MILSGFDYIATDECQFTMLQAASKPRTKQERPHDVWTLAHALPPDCKIILLQNRLSENCVETLGPPC